MEAVVVQHRRRDEAADVFDAGEALLPVRPGPAWRWHGDALFKNEADRCSSDTGSHVEALRDERREDRRLQRVRKRLVPDGKCDGDFGRRIDAVG